MSPLSALQACRAPLALALGLAGWAMASTAAQTAAMQAMHTAAPAAGPSQTIPAIRSAERITTESVDAAIASARRLGGQRVAEGLPSISLAVAANGEILWAEAFGQADLENQRAATTQTRYRIGSTSKPITAALAGRLLDRNDVDLDFEQPIDLPASAFPAKPLQPTLAQLLSNQGGVRHYGGGEYVSTTHYQSLTDGLAIFRDDPLLFDPGTRFHYSSYGFNLAAVVLERAAGSDYLSLIQREVFEPLGMTSSGPDDVTLTIAERAKFYSDRGRGSIPTLPVDDSYKYPSGGLLSTPSDLALFGSAFLSPGFLLPGTLSSITTPRPTANGDSTGYALGWRIRVASEDFPYRALHHGGSSMGGRSMLVVVPEAKIVVAILTNSDAYQSKENDAFNIAKRFAEALH